MKIALDKLNKDCPSINRLLQVSHGSECWNALLAALKKEERELLLIIDGLDDGGHEFTKELCGFISQLPGSVKTLLTSKPQEEIKALLEGVLSIEYDKERIECLNTLRFENTRYRKISDSHEGSLQWLWTHEQYQKWTKSNCSSLLYIQGKPGSGKSTLVKYFKENLLRMVPSASPAIIACFFYTFREGERQRSHYNMLRSILYDILNQDESCFFHFQPEYREYRKLQEQGYEYLQDWHYKSLKKILLSIGDRPTMKQLYLIIDAVDESYEKDRRDILQLLFNLCSKNKNHCVVRVFVASRPVGEIQRYTAKFQGIIRMQDMNQHDISHFVRSFFSETGFPADIVDRATNYIVTHSHGVFLWVRLVCDELDNYATVGSTEKQIFDFLESLPTELDKFYERILNTLESGTEQDTADGIKMFQFVLFSSRPILVSELRDALAISDDADIDHGSIPTVESFRANSIVNMHNRIIHCGRNLLEAKGTDDVSIEASVQVMHQTVREFFFQPNGPVASSKFRMIEGDSHIRITTTCIRYLAFCAAYITTQFPHITHIDSWTPENFESYVKYLKQRPFINYALGHTKDHIAKC
ncbi:hypothetical protein K440DRAFT_677960, partial [Wilcoxina mikolae CBS 423.85]